MRLVARTIACIVVLLLTAKISAQVVNIADPNLEQAIREELDKPNGDLAEADLQQLVRLFASHRNIVTLEGFTTATKLEVLDLSFNALSNVALTPGFPRLEYAMFHGNEITNFTADGILPSLMQLRLSENFITDVAFLKQMPQLAYLELDYNEVTVFSHSDMKYLWLNLVQRYLSSY